jgi:AcrR family transcriptional regulator
MTATEGGGRTRAQAQRERILDAAQRCFIAQGFHEASMASIAQAAEMSAGLIYRYFPGKHAIILAIIERELAKGRSRISALSASTDVTTELVRAWRGWRERSPDEFNVALFLSMSADGARDATIAQALHASDRRIREDLVAWLVEAKGMRRDVAERRAPVMQSLFEGLALREVREPALDIDTIEPELRRVLDALVRT